MDEQDRGLVVHHLGDEFVCDWVSGGLHSETRNKRKEAGGW